MVGVAGLDVAGFVAGNGYVRARVSELLGRENRCWCGLTSTCCLAARAGARIKEGYNND